MVAATARSPGEGGGWRRFLGYVVLIFFALVFIFPFILALVSSFKTLPDIQANPVQLWADPEYGGWTLDGIRGLNTQSVRIPRWALNSTVVTVIATLGRVFLASLAGYALAKMSYPGKQILFAADHRAACRPRRGAADPQVPDPQTAGAVATAMAALILPLMFDAFAIFLMKQFFEQLPDELIEAAAIDGAVGLADLLPGDAPVGAAGIDRPHHPLGAGDLERVPPSSDRSSRRPRAGHPAPGPGQSEGLVRRGPALEHHPGRHPDHHHPHRHRLLRVPALLRPGGGRHRGQGLSPLLRVEDGKVVIDTDRCRAVIFDMDGVITDSVPAHRKAWKETFDSFLDEIGSDAPRFDEVADYLTHVDGKPRYDGVRDFLASRGIELPEGTPNDPPDELTVSGVGNRKNEMFLRGSGPRRGRALSVDAGSDRRGARRRSRGGPDHLEPERGGSARPRPASINRSSTQSSTATSVPVSVSLASPTRPSFSRRRPAWRSHRSPRSWSRTPCPG